VNLGVYVTGQKAFGAAVAGLVASQGHRLTGIASPAWSGPDRPDRLMAAADRLGAPWTASTDLGPSSIPAGTDVIIAAHSHAFVGQKTRARASLASVGYHPSLLPLHRGRDAVRWTIRDRDRVTGGTVYHLSNAVDGGPVAAQDYVLVPPGITAGELWRDLLFPLGLRLIGGVLADLAGGAVVCVPQDETCATWEPSWERPRLHRPDLPELPSGRTDVRYVADRAALHGRV
jgi:methionyl-tRNA formyltransferase